MKNNLEFAGFEKLSSLCMLLKNRLTQANLNLFTYYSECNKSVKILTYMCLTN